MTTTLLLILDGFGNTKYNEANSIRLANTPCIDELMQQYPTVEAYASGMEVGLPEGQMGNSEVGHLNIGAGRIVYQELTRITKAIQDGSILKNDVLVKAMEHAKKDNCALHFMGLLSDGGVHSHNTHLYGLIEMAKNIGVKKIYVHAFLDGRDVAPDSAKGFIIELEDKLKEIGAGKIASISGRYYAMDRDNRWERVERAYNTLIHGEGNTATSATAAITDSYEREIFDEFVEPTIIDKDGTIKENDSVIFFNFRPDRAREITRALVDKEFKGFHRDYVKTYFVALTQYDVTITNKEVAFPPQTLDNTFGEYISKLGKKQLRIAETEKYAHVTFFFNGGVEAPNPNEDRILVDSPKVATYDLQPEMSVYEVTNKLVEQILLKKYDIIIANFANPDMVGHTGDLEAAIAAVEAVDASVEKVIDAIKEVGGNAIITADHGNAEQMEDYENHSPFTAHTTNPVPVILVNYKKGVTLRNHGKLADLIPTVLDMMDIPKPAEMTGTSLLIKN
ncbi:phosphoglycerate mutase (2,3-diphosphoglycerate-independent) [Candidatus Epulonipiscium fishelsonii]|uniref:Phosphoglycerate mutase (2,3-diphosphoglycerate-independent) n=1 Tax=Candidatus Epulonipiscium fishelsonii TaxID=77094 RepID=A0ACC8XFK4_9FIRM|nr:phosphoglycerate mutase (2,3-diphosphoglycerate-independent) [Epulopiscium sp. SCG-B05WGA-EpuloA1]ONI42057.1 phosphoglycerate mutase (2,3-diphosphoglycerate-independent) [Epulopiscium sp. SCG-B11WGA-EpuloA1]